jgi:hypothetical protein
MIRHIVFCKFKPDAGEAIIAQFIRECDKLPSINREVKNWVSGPSPEPRFHSGDFDWALSCDLEDWDAMDRYMWHEAHLRMGPWAAEAIEFLQSFDFEVDYQAPPDFPEAEHPVNDGQPQDLPTGQLALPNVRGRTTEEATRLLIEAGLTVSPETEDVLGSVWAPGRVNGTDPNPGVPVDLGTTVTLIVSGPWWSKPHLPVD